MSYVPGASTPGIIDHALQIFQAENLCKLISERNSFCFVNAGVEYVSRIGIYCVISGNYCLRVSRCASQGVTFNVLESSRRTLNFLSCKLKDLLSFAHCEEWHRTPISQIHLRSLRKKGRASLRQRQNSAWDFLKTQD